MKVAHLLPRLRSGLTGTLLLFVFGCLLTACITSDQALESNPKDPRAQDITDKIRALDLEPRQTIASGETSLSPGASRQPAIYLSEGTRGPNSAAAANEAASSGGGFDLNFDNAPVATVAKVILGDIMGVGYSIDPRVQGTVTLASVRPIPKVDALYVLENALRMSNVALVKDRNGGYRLIPANEAGGSGGIDRTATAEPGQGISVVPLRYVSAQNVFKLLDAFGVKANTIRPDVARNTLIIQGSGADRNAAIETIQSFDADWMRGQSVGIFPLRNSAPEPVISEIEKIMDSGEGGMSQSMIKFQPIARLNSILVVSQKPEFLKRAGTWVARLDQADMDGTNLKVYPLRYGNSRQVTALLNEILVGQKAGGTLDGASSQISPGSGISSASSPPAPLVALSGVPPASPGSQVTLNANIRGANNPGTSPADTGVPAQDLSAAGGAGTNNARPAGILPNVRITADTTNNSILVYANREAHRIIEQTIRQIDRPQRQIAIEATIAEVTLNDNLNYGVQFFLSSQNLGLKPDTGSLVNNLASAATSAAINRVLPGFNLLVGSEASPRVVLDALHGVTNVKVLSNPSLVVLDNQTATLQVGDQVPVSTGSATVLTSNNTVVNTIDYRNTGIILRVLPRANANGNVVLDIEQEISNVAAGTPATSLTPTVSQRRVKSSISVVSGQTVLLAGLISEREDKGRQGIPVLDQIPGVGDAFGRQTNARSRTELILFIRPTVVRDALDAHMIAEELRSKMNGRLVGTSLPVPVVPSRPAR
ncbi:type II secretion system secretin GspD [Bradyrhizobium prioriisuperbiae]|uniref:type II secretion system secretin GspD n=1 Tax=Bradyrhizobium prioriisuperbiae TaxID=2854389 RepID=UPI0038994309